MVKKTKEFLVIVRKKITKKFFLSHFLTFLIPFIVLSTVLTISMAKNIKEELKRENISQKERISESLNNHFAILNEIGADISLNPRIRKIYQQIAYDSPTQSTEAELRRYAMFSPLVDNLYLYYDDEGTFDSTTGTLSLEAFFDVRYKNYVFDRKEFKENLFDEKPMLFTASYENEKRVFYFIPFSYQGVRIGRIIFELSINQIEKSLSALLNEESGVLLFIQKMPIVTYGIGEETNQYIVADTKPDELGIKISSVVHKNYLNQRVFKVIFMELMLLLVFFALGIFIVLRLSIRSYHPIARLNKVYHAISKEVTDEKEDVIQNIGDYLFKQSLIDSDNKKQLSALKNNTFLEYALRGFHGTLEEMIEKSQEFGREYSKDHSYLVALTTTEYSKDTTQSLKIKSILNAKIPFETSDFKMDLVELIHEHLFVFIIEIKNKQLNEKQLNDIKQEFEQFFETTIGLTPAFFYGEYVQELNELNDSYVQAQTKRTAPFIITTIQEEQTWNLPEERVLTLCSAIQYGSIEVIQKVIEELFSNQPSSIRNAVINESYDYYVFNKLIEFMQKEHLTIPIEIKEVNRQNLLELSLLMAEKFQVESIKQEAAVGEKIIDLLNENFDNPDFSLEELAIKFDTSLPKMSQTVKEQIGTSFSKYIQELRIEKAKELLVRTQLPIKDIVEEVGYMDNSSFTRKFRDIVGIPPGAFRKLNREKMEHE
ncbi:MAG: AraC family transcriptional regulator [Streptococcaceae bacterium]|nr:AraC family transcriptional regulator [Streptococcaceae bacterium]